MTAQEEFQVYKAEYEKKLLTRARVQAIVLGSATVITVMAMLYGLVNNIEAGAQRDIAVANEQKAIEAKLEADSQREMAAELKSKLTDCNQMVEALKEVDLGMRGSKDALSIANAKVAANLERAMKAEAWGKRQSQIALDLKTQLDKCKSGK
jgi:hypothetical protein